MNREVKVYKEGLDYLTGIYNRVTFLKRSEELLDQHHDQIFALIRIDILKFRLFNTFYGTREGDQMLIRFGELLKAIYEPVEMSMYGRIGSDIFAVLEPYDPEMIEKQTNEILERLSGMYRDYRVSATFGIYVISNPVEADMEAAYSYATEAAKKAKHEPTQMLCYYDREMYAQLVREQELANMLDTALKEEQFVLYLQPKFDLKTEKPSGAEALVRWRHPEKGMISPSEFVPVFEQNGLVQKLDYYMWEHCCMVLRRWLDEGLVPLPISVNVSRISLYNPHVVEDICALMEKYQIPKSLLHLEITESAYMADKELMDFCVRHLREQGFTLMMDDFGSGYSSLNALKDIEMDILKMDMQFLPTKGEQNVRGEKILTAVIRMASWLGMPVVMEGVETQAQKDFLMSIGCDYIQGFYYAKPLSVPDYEQLVFFGQEKNENGEFLLPPLAKNNIRPTDLDTFWASNADISLMLNSFLVPYAVYTYSNGRLDVLRTNKAYQDSFQCDHLMDNVTEGENALLRGVLDHLAADQRDREIYITLTGIDGAPHEYAMKVHYIYQVGLLHLLSITFIQK